MPDQTFRLPDGRVFYATPSGTWDVRDAGPEDEGAPDVPWETASVVSQMNAAKPGGTQHVIGGTNGVMPNMTAPTPNQYDSLPRVGPRATSLSMEPPQILSRTPQAPPRRPEVEVSKGAPTPLPESEPLRSALAALWNKGGDGTAVAFGGVPPGPMGHAVRAAQQATMGGAGHGASFPERPGTGGNEIHPAIQQLLDAQRQRDSRGFVADMARAGQMVGGGISRAAGGSGAVDEMGLQSLEAKAQQPMADLAQRQQAQAGQAQMARNAASQKALAAIVGQRPAFRDIPPEVLAQASPDVLLKALEAAQKGDAQAQKAAHDAVMERFAGERAQTQRYAAATNAGLKREMMDFNQGRVMGERQVGGLDFAPGRVPSANDAAQMKGAIEQARDILSSLDQMERIYGGADGEGKGAEFLFGADRATSEAARTNVLMKLKELQNLGVLQIVDVEWLSKQIPDPNSMRGVLDPTGMRAKFGEFKRQVAETVRQRAAARGYVPDAASPFREGAGAPAAAGGRIRVTNGSETLEIDPADLADAEKDGFRRAG